MPAARVNSGTKNKKPPEGGSQFKPYDRRSGGNQCWLSCHKQSRLMAALI
jgi:hypothetical protein